MIKNLLCQDREIAASSLKTKSVLRLYQFVARDDVVLATLYGLARVPAPDTFGHAVSKNWPKELVEAEELCWYKYLSYPSKLLITSSRLRKTISR